MPKYELRLESQTDSQARILSLDAESVAAARETAQQQELDIVNFSLLPPERDVWECPPGTDPDDPNGVVDLSRWDAYDPGWAKWASTLPYDEAVKAADERLSDFENSIDIAANGKVRGRDLGKHSTARLLAHKQTAPYDIVEVREIDESAIDAQRLVRQLASLKHNSPAQWALALEELHAQGIPLAAVTAFLNGLSWEKQINGSSVTVFSSATVKMSLHTALTGNMDSDDFFNDISGTEITGTGYSAGGYTFAAKASTYDTASDQIRLDNTTDPNWTTSTLSATDAAVWVDTAGASSTDPVYGEVDFGATVTTTAGTFTVTLDATGWAVFDLT